MNWKNISISISFLLVFILAVFFSYQKFYAPIISPLQKNQLATNMDQVNNGIYFQSVDDFYIANADISSDRLLLPDKVQVDDFKDINIFAGDSLVNKSVETPVGIYTLKIDTINNGESSNIYFLDLKTNINKAITNIAFPLKVANFKVSTNQKYIAYTVTNVLTNGSNINICKADGTNLLQLTDDDVSNFPVFSPDDTKIAFWRKDLGIYIINIDKSNLIKILNFESKIDEIFAWRQNES